MTSKRLAKLLAAVVLAAANTLIFPSCKPTEKNYQAAYEKAYEASRRKKEEMTTGSGGQRLESLDGPRREVVDGDTILVSSVIVEPFESTSPLAEGKVGAAIARYSMPTNARRNAEDIKGAFPEAFVGTDGQGAFYVVLGRVPTVEDAADATRRFRISFPRWPYVGLDGHPQILFVVD